MTTMTNENLSMSVADRGKWNVVAIVSSDHMAAIIAASALRKAGFAVETFLTGNRKKQWQKASRYEVLIDLDRHEVRDMVLGGRQPLSDNILRDAQDALDGIE